MLKDYFRLEENGSSVRTEALAGVTTFATMACIVFVQPVVLGAAGMDAGAVFTSTCLITAFSTVLNGRLPRAGRALLADAIGTVGSALVGNTTMVSYIESASGVAVGGRTGLAALVTAGLFLIAMFFSPVVQMISGGFAVHEVITVEGQQVARAFTLYPVTSPALIVVGSLMIRSVRDIEWDDFTEALPAFLTVVLVPLTFSISDGIAFGFISYALLKLVTGRAREAHWLIYVFAVLFIARYAVPGLH